MSEKKVTNEKRFTINQLAEKVELSPCYVRRMIHQGKLESKMVNISPKVQRHEITMTQYKTFRSKTSIRTTRNDGRNKFTVYLTSNEEVKMRKNLISNNQSEVEKLLSRTNVSK